MRPDRPLRVVIVEDSERILALLEEALAGIDNLTVAGKSREFGRVLELVEDLASHPAPAG